MEDTRQDHYFCRGCANDGEVCELHEEGVCHGTHYETHFIDHRNPNKYIDIDKKAQYVVSLSDFEIACKELQKCYEEIRILKSK